MKNATYTIQYWNGKEAEWKPAGLHTFTDLDEARKFAKAQAKMTGYTVDFRIERNA
jgi:hypothetical protein